jgi:hypothetical protein
MVDYTHLYEDIKFADRVGRKSKHTAVKNVLNRYFDDPKLFDILTIKSDIYNFFNQFTIDGSSNAFVSVSENKDFKYDVKVELSECTIISRTFSDETKLIKDLVEMIKCIFDERNNRLNEILIYNNNRLLMKAP